jgi:hypothetical protein
VLSNSEAVCDYLRTTLTGAPREQVRVLFLDRRHHLIAVHLGLPSFSMPKVTVEDSAFSREMCMRLA